MMAFGRLSFAYPDFVNDIIQNKKLDKNKICISCDKCTQLKRASIPTGCVVRNPDTYMNYYTQLK